MIKTMKFNEAMEKLQAGHKVTRQKYEKELYFKKDEDDMIKTFQPKIDHYVYDENIMLSDGWEVEGIDDKNLYFYDIIPWLQSRRKAWRFDWNESYIIYDQQMDDLIYHTMAVMPFMPNFESFTALDWMVIYEEK